MNSSHEGSRRSVRFSIPDFHVPACFHLCILAINPCLAFWSTCLCIYLDTRFSRCLFFRFHLGSSVKKFVSGAHAFFVVQGFQG